MIAHPRRALTRVEVKGFLWLCAGMGALAYVLANCG